MKVNLGAGGDIQRGWVNHDVIDLPGIDCVHDLDVFPWPWEDESASRVKAYDVFEHIMKPYEFMREAWRVLAPGSVLDLRSVHHRSPNYHRDPGHWRALDDQSLDYWVPGTFLGDKYGAAYARGCVFEKLSVTLGGDGNLTFLLRKIAR